MKKNPLLFLVAVLAALVLVYFGASALIKNSNEKKAAQTAEENKVTETGEIAEISYAVGDLSFRFKKGEDGWVSEGYESFPLKQDIINSLSDSISSLQTVRVLDEHEALSEYGLDNPSVIVTLKNTYGEEKILRFGSTTQSGNFYLTVDGDERVLTVSSEIISSLPSDIFSLVDYETPPVFTQADVKAIKLTADGDEYIYTKNELEAAAENGAGYEWLCQKNGVSTSPLFENVETAAYDLASLSLKACVAYSADADAVTFFGITEPYATLEVTVSTDEGDETCKLVFGDVYGESDIVAALNQSHSVTITDFGNVSEIVSLLKSV